MPISQNPLLERADSDCNRFLIPEDFTFQQFQGVMRKRLMLPETKSLYIFFMDNRINQNGTNEFLTDRQIDEEII
jgi:hypothetical protein